MGSKRNEFLDGLSDDEAEIPNRSDDERDSRFRKLSNKRRKVSHVPSEDEDENILSDASSIQQDEQDHFLAKKGSSKPEKSSKTTTVINTPSLTPKQLALSQAKLRKTGVLYLSRVPPFMKPNTLRHFLEPWGPLARLFLTPEPRTAYLKRTKAGGNKKPSYIDGWIEFESKKRARECADALNGQIIGGKKGGWYHDDVWNLKYLKGFKWDDLMEEVRAEDREREAKMDAERRREGRERKGFVRNAEQAKVMRGLEKHKEKKKAALGEGDPPGTAGSGNTELSKARQREMTFTQSKVRVRDPGAAERDDRVKRVLSKIF